MKFSSKLSLFLIISLTVLFLFSGCSVIQIFCHFKVINNGLYPVENVKISVPCPGESEKTISYISPQSESPQIDYHLYNYTLMGMYTACQLELNYTCNDINYSKKFERLTINGGMKTTIKINGSEVSIE